MGWFSSRVPELAASSSPDASAVHALNEETRQQAAGLASRCSPPLSEAEQLDLLVGGGQLDNAAAENRNKFLGSNRRHTYVDGVLSCAAYTFSGLQHIQGQSNALTLLTMWTVGTAFLVDIAERRYLQKALQGVLVIEDSSAPQTEAAPSNEAQRRGPDRSSNYHASEGTLVPRDNEKLAEQQQKVFLTQTVASWVWMLASLQQFKVHKRLKWCGYSSWMGLCCAGYYSTRHLYNVLVQ